MMRLPLYPVRVIYIQVRTRCNPPSEGVVWAYVVLHAFVLQNSYTVLQRFMIYNAVLEWLDELGLVDRSINVARMDSKTEPHQPSPLLATTSSHMGGCGPDRDLT